MTDKPRSYGFLVETDRYGGCDSVVARVLVREGDSAYPINPRSEGEDSIWDAPKRTHGLALAGLLLRCWKSEDGRYFHGPFVNYHTVYHVDTRLALRMAKTLTRIDRALTKAKAREAGDVLMTVAKAIGASFYVHSIGQHRASMYSDDRWRFGELIEARDKLRELVKMLEPAAAAAS